MSSFIHKNTEFPNKNLVDFSSLEVVFEDLKDRPQWVVSTPTGVPYNPFKRANASCSNPEDWFTLLEALQWCKENEGYLPSLSLKGTDLCVFDLDDCLDSNGEEQPSVREILDQLGSYAEISRSGKGLHIVLRGKKLGNRCKSGNFEVYDSTNAKFISLTGNVFRGLYEIKTVSQEILDTIYEKIFQTEGRASNHLPKSPLMSDEEVLRLCRHASNREKFIALYDRGDIRGYGADNSAADLALCSILSFYTQDFKQIDCLFQNSALHKNLDRIAKWARVDYKTATITKALESSKTHFQAKKEAGIHAAVGSWDKPVLIEMQEDLDIPFPIHCLPITMRNAVLEVERSVQVDPAMAVIPALGVAALQLGKKIIAVEKEGLEHHTSLFLLCVMKQVERKSETWKRILEPIKDAIEEEYENHKKETASVKAHNDAVDEQIVAVKSSLRNRSKQSEEKEYSIQGVKQQLEELLLSKKEFPSPPQNWGDDITPERLQQRLHAHKGAFGLFSSEGRGVLHRICDKDDTGGSVGKSIYTAATWGDDLLRSRVGANGEPEECSVRKPALTIALCVQEDIWAEFSSDKTMRQNGTLSRICVVNPPSRAGTRFEQEEEEPFNPERIKPFAEAIIRIRKWNPAKPVYVRLSKGAKRLRRDFYNELEKESGPCGKYETEADIVGRACSITTRIAAIFAVLDSAEQGALSDNIPDITEDQWQQAQALEDYFLSQSIDTQRIRGLSSKEHLLQKVARWLLKQLKKGDTLVSAAVLKDRIRGLKEEKNETVLATIMSALEKAGWVKPGNPTRKGGISYEINSKVIAFEAALGEHCKDPQIRTSTENLK